MKLSIHSENTIDPKCRHFRQCGGCQFQHIPYDEQLAHKKKFVSHCFGREVEPIIPCEPWWRYRNKMEFSFGQSKSGDKFLGLMKQRGRVENLSECFLTNPWFVEVLENVRLWWQQSPLDAYFPPGNRGLLRTLTLREGIRSREKMVVLTVSEEEFEESAIQEFIDSMPPIDSLILRKQIIQKKVPTRFEERTLHGKNSIQEHLYDADGKKYHFQIRAASFFQPNTLQAETIYQKAIESALLSGNEEIFDLYCGTGSIGIFASKHSARVFGIEIVPEAVEDAQANLLLNGITNMQVAVGDAGEWLKDPTFSPSAVFVDPPRAGLGPKTVEQLKDLKPEKIVYISCNPVSQAADCEALGYDILSLQPVDQFPHTPHIENIALLKRKK